MTGQLTRNVKMYYFRFISSNLNPTKSSSTCWASSSISLW